jgi:hypothetical protein
MFSMTIEASCDVMFTIRRAGLHRPRRRLQHSQRPEEEAEHALDVLGRSLEHVARLVDGGVVDEDDVAASMAGAVATSPALSSTMAGSRGSSSSARHARRARGRRPRPPAARHDRADAARVGGGPGDEAPGTLRATPWSSGLGGAEQVGHLRCTLADMRADGVDSDRLDRRLDATRADGRDGLVTVADDR